MTGAEAEGIWLKGIARKNKTKNRRCSLGDWGGGGGGEGREGGGGLTRKKLRRVRRLVRKGTKGEHKVHPAEQSIGRLG